MEKDRLLVKIDSNTRIISGFIVTKGIEEFNGYPQLIYRAERIKKIGYVNSFIAFRYKDLIELIRRENRLIRLENKQNK